MTPDWRDPDVWPDLEAQILSDLRHSLDLHPEPFEITVQFVVVTGDIEPVILFVQDGMTTLSEADGPPVDDIKDLIGRFYPGVPVRVSDDAFDLSAAIVIDLHDVQ